MTTNHVRRLDRLRQRLAAAEPALDAIVLTNAESRRYLSDFTGSAGQLLVTASAAVLLTDFRYLEQAAAQAPRFEIVKTEGLPWPTVAEQIARLGARQIGFESEDLTFDVHRRLAEALGEKAPAATLLPMRGFVAALRQAKDASELAAIRRAVLIADRALEAVAAALRPGLTEREVAWQLEVALRERGADGLSFPTIVAAGPNGARPHHRPSQRAIQRDEPIIIDMGCRVDGYCSDMTRTLWLGEPSATFWAVYHTVLRAQQACADGVKAGLLGKDGDRLARRVIEDAGHGDHFGHGTGHGVGLAIHEEPYLSPSRGEMALVEGAVVTVEPGIYLTGWGGVRIEDMIVVGTERSLVLTTAHKAPAVETGR
jgi:Xaa-Pro aminopeptidase